MKTRSQLSSFLCPDIERFIAHKRALGRRYDVEEKTLRLLDHFLLERQVLSLEEVTPALIDEFLGSRPRSRPRSYNHLRCTVGRLFGYLVGHGKMSRTPLQSPPRRSRYQRSPFIFDQAAARRLLSAARSLADRGGTLDRGNTYYVIFAILYGLGLRVGEVCRLLVKDVDLDRRVLVVRQTKFYKSRLVPFGPKIEALLRQQLVRCQDRTVWQCRPGDRAVSIARRASNKSRHRQHHISAARTEASSHHPAGHFPAEATRFAPCLCRGNARPLVPRRRRSAGTAAHSLHLSGARRYQLDRRLPDNDTGAVGPG